MELNHLGLFEGIGGFSLAAQWMGWETKAWCEINPFCQTVLKHHFPKAECFEDIKLANFEKFKGKIDIITGGFPCQPYSSAGKRKGKEDERHLWPYMLKTIRAVQPRWVVGENVLGLVDWNGGLVFHEVQTDLEAAGYEVFPYVLPACAVNAPHRRDRIWFVAYAGNNGFYGAENRQSYPQGNDNNTARKNTTKQFKGCGSEAAGKIIANTTGSEYKEGLSSRKEEKYSPPGNTDDINDWQNFPTQSPICGGDDGLPAELDGITFSKWRSESIKAYGNAIVPQVALQIFKAIEQYEAKGLSRIGH